MQTVHLTPADIARTRFATASIPLLESFLALAAHRITGRPVQPGDASGLRAATRPLLDLAMGQVGPVFLDPLASDVEEGLELVRATPKALLRSELDRVLSPRATPVPTWVRNLADGDREEREIVQTAVRACHDLFITPHRAAHDRAFQQDIAARTPDLRRGGIAAVLANLHPRIRFRNSTLEMPHQRDQAWHLHGQGLELMPSATWTGAPLLTWAWNQPDRWLLIYPATATITPDTDVVAPLIGATRAALLRQLAQPVTTGELAIRLNLSAGSVSQHTTVLRNAGLIASQRDGRTVHHVLTALGKALLAGERYEWCWTGQTIPSDHPGRS